MRGFLWCKTDHKTTVARSAQTTTAFLSAAVWFIRLYKAIPDRKASADEQLDAIRRRANDSFTEAQLVALLTYEQLDQGRPPPTIAQEME